MKYKQIKMSFREKILHNSAVDKARQYKKFEAELLIDIEEIDRLKLFEKFDHVSSFKYCFHVLKLPKAMSYAFHTVARKSRTVPQLLAAVNDGLSIWTANILASQITLENCEMWIEKARLLPQLDLQWELAAANPKKRRATKKEPIDKSHSRMAMDIPNTTLAKLIRAQELVGGTEAEVLNMALEILLEKKDPVRRADRAMKKLPSLSVQTESFVNAKLGVRIPYNARTYHEVNERDRGACQKILADGTKCGSTRWVEIHHILEVAKGGTNETSNLTTLCSAHHRIHHHYQSSVWSPTVAYSA